VNKVRTYATAHLEMNRSLLPPAHLLHVHCQLLYVPLLLQMFAKAQLHWYCQITPHLTAYFQLRRQARAATAATAVTIPCIAAAAAA